MHKGKLWEVWEMWKGQRQALICYTLVNICFVLLFVSTFVLCCVSFLVFFLHIYNFNTRPMGKGFCYCSTIFLLRSFCSTTHLLPFQWTIILSKRRIQSKPKTLHYLLDNKYAVCQYKPKTVEKTPKPKQLNHQTKVK